MKTFDEVLPTLVETVSKSAVFSQLKEICVVRDLAGRVRLVLLPRPGEDISTAVEALELALASSLGGYFSAPVLSTTGSQEIRRLAKNVLQIATGWPSNWPQQPPPVQWRAVQRVLSKEAWLTSPAAPPWPMVEGRTPAIVSFYSFKGGVGRTTLLGIVARQLVREKFRVCAIDLDLEAPGLGVLLGVASAERGVLDYVVDHTATGSSSLHGLVHPATALEADDASRLDVIPAGRVNWSYLEKLARLDFASTRPEAAENSPVAQSLTSLLAQVRTHLRPDFILLDSRAGFHDLGGLSLHSLGHVDVLVGRASDQALAGLRIAVEALARRRSEFNSVIVHSMAPLASTEMGAQERDRFRAQAYEIFNQFVYSQLDDDEPAIDDDSADHYPRPVTQLSELERIGSLRDAPEALLDSAEYRSVTDRLKELCVSAPEDEEGA